MYFRARHSGGLESEPRSSRALEDFVVARAALASRSRLRRECAKLSEKRRWTRTVRKSRQGAKRVFLSNGQPGADGVGIDADALEFVEQTREPFRL